MVQFIYDSDLQVLIFPRRHKDYTHSLEFDIYSTDSNEFEIDAFKELSDDKHKEYLENSDCSLIVNGFVKWDGCSNWQLVKQDCMLHYCTREQMLQISGAMQLCYDFTAANLETFDK